MLGTEIVTDRLILRDFRASDGDALYAYLSDPEVVRFEPYDVFAYDDALTEAARRATDEHFIAVCTKDGALIGNLYAACEQGDTWEIGYVFARAAWGHGYACQAATALLARLFTACRARRVVAHCNQQNARSWHLLERLGMRREGDFLQNVSFTCDENGEPIWCDTYAYGLLKTEWSARNG